MIKYKDKKTGKIVNEEVCKKKVMELVLELIAKQKIDGKEIKSIYEKNEEYFIENLLLEYKSDKFNMIHDFELDFDLRKLREFKGITQKEIASLLNLSISGYRKKEKGTVKFYINEFYTLCEYFEKSEQDMKIIIENIHKKATKKNS